jgi:adenylate kinase
MFNLILFGPPGSGKGTQSEKLIAKYSLKHLSTGDLLRSQIAHQTPLGLEAKHFMDKGQLVPDEVVVDIIRNRISQADCNGGFIVDGFPRNLSQAIIFDQMLESLNKKIDVVFDFEAEDEVLLNKLPVLCLKFHMANFFAPPSNDLPIPPKAILPTDFLVLSDGSAILFS